MSIPAINAVAKDLGSQAAIASVLGISAGAVSQLVSGHRSVPPDRCPALERATVGRVTCEELRPDVRWQRVADPEWPHPLGRPCIDVAAPVPAPAPPPVPAVTPEHPAPVKAAA